MGQSHSSSSCSSPDSPSTPPLMLTMCGPPPPDDGCSPILDQPMDTMEKIFSFLPISDLARLSRACHRLHCFITSFLTHQVTSAGLEAAFKTFMSSNKELLTVAEMNLFDSLLPSREASSGIPWQAIFSSSPPTFKQQHTAILEKLKSIENLAGLPEDSAEKRWMIWWLFVQRRYFEKNVIRVSVVDEERVGFPHRGNERYIPIVMNHDLGRSVVDVRNVCWLQINTTFRDLAPGTYVLSLRCKIATSGLRWPHEENQNMYLSLQYPAGGSGKGEESLEKVVLNRKWWQTVERNQTPDYSDAELLLHTHTKEATGRPVIEFDFETKSRLSEEERREEESGSLLQNVLRIVRSNEETPWFMLSLPPVKLNVKGDIEFELKDTECGWWKGGLIFDFIQLRKID